MFCADDALAAVANKSVNFVFGIKFLISHRQNCKKPLIDRLSA